MYFYPQKALKWTLWDTDIPPEIFFIDTYPKNKPLVCMLGNQDKTQKNSRYGIIGVPSDVVPIYDSIKKSVDSYPKNKLRVFLLNYEGGFKCVSLPLKSLGIPLGFILDLENYLIIDHHTKTYSYQGDEQNILHFYKKYVNSFILKENSKNILFQAMVSDKLHKDRIYQALEHIKKGDIYQANISRPVKIYGAFSPARILYDLYHKNPVSHAAYIRFNDIEILSNSMETLLNYTSHDRLAVSYPIKGTYPRKYNENKKSLIPKQLKNDPKERSEHIMIVDLIRNDLGKVCTVGSVDVLELMKIYGFQYVWHGISTIQGKLSFNKSMGDLVEAIFPGGSITGVPKRRAIEIIADIEKEDRGFYTGSLGLITPQGDLNMSILIRTLIKSGEGFILNVGGGIVFDSIPEREIQETWEKIKTFKKNFAL